MAAQTLQTPKVKLSNKITFSGHKGPVTSLSISKDSSLLASSSEDQTIRIWSLEDKKSRKIILPDPSLFKLPTTSENNDEKGEIPEISCISFVLDHIILAAVGSELVAYNLQKPDVIIKNAEVQLNLGAGEINSIDLAILDDSTACTLLCSCDDAVVIIDMTLSGTITMTQRQKMENAHSAFCTTARLLSSSPSLEYVSGGFDSKVCFVKMEGQKAEILKSLNLNAQDMQPSGNVKQMFNPPYIHAIDISKSSPWIVAATGSGNLEFIHSKHFVRTDPVETHSSSANTVAFAAVPGVGEVLVSSGSEGILSVRSFASPVEADVVKYADIRSRQRELELKIVASKKPASKPQAKLFANFEKQLSQLKGIPITQSLVKVKLTDVPNWITYAPTVTASGNLFIADTTNNITCLTLSRQS